MTNLEVKKKMDSKQLAILASEFEKRSKSKVLLYVLWWFTGVIGGHRYYLGDTGKGIAMTLTLGGLGFWALFDVFFIGKRLAEVNEKIESAIITEIF